MTYQESLLQTGAPWMGLNEAEKVAVLQQIENHMAAEWGRSPCIIEAKALYTGADGIVMGLYDPREDRIYVNALQFDPDAMYGKDSDRMLETCLHEGRHAFQHQVADGKVPYADQQEAALWRENLKAENYITYEENPLRYQTQPVERDARAFGRSQLELLKQERYTLEQQKEEQQAREAFAARMESPAEAEEMTQKVRLHEGYGH